MSSTIWSFDWTARICIIWKKCVKIEEQLTEMLDHRFGQRQVLAQARYLAEDCEPIMLKIRYGSVSLVDILIALPGFSLTSISV